jgi:tetratricopeptide (TPR) repeat protein
MNSPVYRDFLMFPHKQLDWHISRLEREVADHPDNLDHQVELARAILSKALYHGGGEDGCTRALAMSRKIMARDSENVSGMVLAGAALVGLGRAEAARKFLAAALDIAPERAETHYSLGALYRSEGNLDRAIHHFEYACRFAPDDWEPHLFLGRTLGELGRKLGGKRRLIERCQYHLIQALKRGPTPELSSHLLRDLGVSCLESGRYSDAERFFVRLRESPGFESVARFHLGLVAYGLGKYKSAITYFRQYLREHPDDARALTQIAMSYLQIGDHPKCQEAANKALLGRPNDVQAKYCLGCSFLEEGRGVEAVRLFRTILQENPQHMPSFIELARARRLAKDVKWLIQALVTEAGKYDRLPLASGETTPRSITRRRIAVLLEELHTIGPSSVSSLIDAIELVHDEGVRFQIWESACRLASSAASDDIADRLRSPGVHYGEELGKSALTAAQAIPEQALTRGLNIEEEDLKRAAVARCSAADDVETHRRNVEAQREAARGYQALLLLAIASRRSRSGRRLLERWSQTADPEIGLVARTGLALFADPEATAVITGRAAQLGAAAQVRKLLAEVVPPESLSKEPRPVSDNEDVHCTTCGRTSDAATHLMAGTSAVMCDHCVVHIGQNRQSQRAADDANCSFCGKTHLESQRVFDHEGVQICNHCLKFALGLVEREEVDRFLSAW